MSTFDDREQAFEKKYAHDSELQFRATARRNKLLGLWAAEARGLAGDAAAAYAKEVVAAGLSADGDAAVRERVAADLAASGAGIDAAAVAARMAELMAEAKAQIATETPD